MTSVLAVATFPTFFEQIPEYRLYGLFMRKIRLIERHHVDEDDMALVHEEVAEQIEGLSFTDSGTVILA
jgi:hypothetical protein